MTDSREPAAPEVEAHRFADDGRISNNPHLPLLLYRRALPPDTPDLARAFEEVFTRNGWPAAWRNGIYPFPHFHSTAHEALGIARGRARVRLGGETGITVEVAAGDAVLVPAGVGHQNLGSSPDLLVVGAYPRGQSADLCRGAAGERPGVLERIAAVSPPAQDPVQGAEGRVSTAGNADDT
jgi:uncharacterized protein YjlB